MAISRSQINKFLFFKLPAAYFCGVRVASISAESCKVRVRHRWINQNPFKSLYWAVQGMAAELSTGALVMSEINASGKKISMLVAANKGSFSKKARGKIHFECNDGAAIRAAVQKAVETGDGQTCWMRSVGTDEVGDSVSEFAFEWTIKLKA